MVWYALRSQIWLLPSSTAGRIRQLKHRGSNKIYLEAGQRHGSRLRRWSTVWFHAVAVQIECLKSLVGSE